MKFPSSDDIGILIPQKVFLKAAGQEYKHSTAQKMKFSIKDFFSKFHQILRKLGTWSSLLTKSLWKILFLVHCLPGIILKRKAAHLISYDYFTRDVNQYKDTLIPQMYQPLKILFFTDDIFLDDLRSLMIPGRLKVN